MTKDQLEAMILANLASQFTQLVALYGAIDAGDTAAQTAAQTAGAKLRDLYNVLQDGLSNLREQERLAAEYASD
jgi:hypothetical protein